MKLSFNIPTYNRAKYLRKSLELIMSQIEELHVEESVEVNLSDNASTDNTKEVWYECVSRHPKIKTCYHCNDHNLGPDRNFLAAMKMANGDYSLLWGDDDYLKEGGLNRIFELIEYGEKNDVQIMLSSTSIIDEDGNYLSEKLFLRDDIKEFFVDFSDLSQVRSYFFLLRDMGGLLSFISDVIYKTSIIHEMPYHDEFTGTHYAFLCYWWGWLAKGKKLYYSSKSFLNETIQYQPAYGYGVKRSMVDYNGYYIIFDRLIKDQPFGRDFLNAFLNLHDDIQLRQIYIPERNAFETNIIPMLRKYHRESDKLTFLVNSCKKKRVTKEFVFSIMPQRMIKLIKDYCKR